MNPSLLKSPGFVNYLVCRLLLGLLLRSLILAVGYHLYELTRDPFALGYLGLATFLPMVGLGLFAGDLADRVNRALLLSASSALATIAAFGFVVMALAGGATVWVFYALTALFGTALAFLRPTAIAILPGLVPRPLLSNGIALTSSVAQIATMVGPAATGVLLVGGPLTAYATVTAIAAMLTVLSFMLRPYGGIGEGKKSDQPIIARISDGIRFVRTRPLILGAMSLDLFATFFGGVIALLPVVAHDVLMVGPASLGLLRSAPAVGSFVAAILLARFASERYAGPKMLTGAVLFGAAIVVFGLSTNFLLSLAALCFSGAADTMSSILRNSVIQMSTPDDMRGRVNSVSFVFIAGSNELGDVRGGITAGLLGVVPAIVIGGIGAMAVGGLWSLLFPSIRRLDRFSDIAEAERARTG